MCMMFVYPVIAAYSYNKAIESVRPAAVAFGPLHIRFEHITLIDFNWPWISVQSWLVLTRVIRLLNQDRMGFYPLHLLDN